MMKSIRTAAKPVYVIVAIAFVGTIFFAWGMDITSKDKRPPNAVGRINDQELSIETFYRSYESKYNELLQTNNDPSEEDIERVREDTWNSLVSQVLMAQQIEKFGINVSPEELTEYVKAMPPGEFRAAEDFQTDGKFDPIKYQNFLQNLAADPGPQAEQYLLFIESTVKSQVLINKLQELVISTAYVSDSEVFEQYRAQNEKIQVKYIFISSGDVDTSDIEVTDDMLLARYEQDKESAYKTEASATLRYVSFPKEPSQADQDSVRNEIFTLYEQLNNGADFEEMAREYSQDASGKDGGDLGWFGRGRMVKPFEDAVFALKKASDLSEPVQSRFGWHIIKLTGKRNKNEQGDDEEQVKASHILLKTEVSSQTLADLKDRAEQFRRAAIEYGFIKAAEDFGLTIESSSPFSEGSPIREFGANQRLNELAFKDKENAISGVEDTRNSYVVATKGVLNPAGYRPFDDVKNMIENQIRQELTNEKTYSKGDSLYQVMISQNLTLDRLAKSAGMTVKETELFSRNDFVKNVGSDAAFIGAAFNLSPERKLSPPIKSRNGCYLTEYMTGEQIDMAQYEAMSDSLFRDILGKSRQDAWRNWYRELYDNAVIEDFRQDAFGS